MMPLEIRCKSRSLEKVEKLCRTAALRKNVSTRSNNSHHACATPRSSYVPSRILWIDALTDPRRGAGGSEQSVHFAAPQRHGSGRI
jgi:hypothetical protein